MGPLEPKADFLEKGRGRERGEGLKREEMEREKETGG